MKTKSLLVIALVTMLGWAATTSADASFRMIGTVTKPATIAPDGETCTVTLRVETVAGPQEKILSAYRRLTCRQFDRLETGQRVEVRGSMFINLANNFVPLVEWIEATE